MTRANPRPRAAAPAPAGGRRLPFDPAPTLSLVGLAIVALATFALLGGSLPNIPGNGNGNGGPIRTPTPSNVVVVDPRTKVPGSLLYVKDGNIWLQSGERAGQLTSGGHDSMPAWAPGGEAIYFIRTEDAEGRWPSGSEVRPYALHIPTLMRIAADGTGTPESLLTGRIRRNGNTWSYFIREPAISPDGKTAALITDGPDPTRSDIVVKLLDLAGGELSDPALAQSQSLGHQDPAWSPDGKQLLYVRNAREGSRGTPAIYRYTVATRKAVALTGPGYTSPSWSRDGRWIAATKTSAFGTDVVILDSRTGAEVLKLTGDENSFSPVWSPKMDSIAFFRLNHGLVDLYLISLSGTGPAWTVGDPLALTISAGLDAVSRPAWFIPADQLPPLPPSAPSPGAPGSAAP